VVYYSLPEVVPEGKQSAVAFVRDRLLGAVLGPDSGTLVLDQGLDIVPVTVVAE
jgi:hypothetical protein